MLFTNFNEQCQKIVEIIMEEKCRFGTIGSELLLYALTKLKSSSCQFILSEYGINQYTVEKRLNKIVVLRKDAKYTHKFNEVIEMAKNIAKMEESTMVFEEHLLYALLTTPNTIALHIIEKMEVDVNDLIDDLNIIYNLGFKDEINNNYLINITKQAKLNRLNPFIGREQTIEKIIRILSKKQKNNPMLIGNAGVGKSALVEGVAMALLKENPKYNIYRLDLGMIIAGTKYRGDLEERLLEVVEKIKNPNAIVFIDEIHNIVGSGSSEGTLDIANILKPILARSEIKCIGATTLDEYYRYIEKDKALARRFQNVFIDEASNEETYEIMKGIVHCYEEYHKVKYPDEILKYIITASEFLANRRLPDKAIDILDESGLVCHLNNHKKVQKIDVDKIIYESLGIKYQTIKSSMEKIKNFPQLKKYYHQYLMNLGIRKTIINLQINEDNLPLLIEDLEDVFNLKSEVILTLDFNRFQENHFTSSLIGSPAGYVGYEDGGILTEHVLKYPIAIIIIKNYKSGNQNINKQIDTILEEGKIIDSKGRTISFKNTIFIFQEEVQKNNIGFIELKTTKPKTINSYIDEILNNINQSDHYRNKISAILSKLKHYNYNLVLDIDNIDSQTYLELIKELSNFENFITHEKYIITRRDNKILIKTTRK